MSEDRRHDRPGDEQLSDAYRELSTEQTSARLDEKILDMARTPSPKKSLSRLLAIKPLAWTATVVLTVSVVYQLQQQEVMDTMIFEEEVAVDMAEPAAVAPTPEADSPTATDMSSFAPAAGARSKLQEVEAMMIEQDAADTSLQQPAERGLSVELGGMRRAAPEPRFCDEAEIADASSWYQCILRLEEEGRLDEAASERTKLFSEYPDFQVR